jgi:predicted nucleic acid-binding protein
MSAEPFVDTNLWVYAHLETPDDPKGDRARALVESGQRLTISTQVLNEYYAALLRNRVPDAEIQENLELMMQHCQVQLLSLETIRRAHAIKNRYGFSLWDALIVASALEAGCALLYSEDLQHGQWIEQSLRIENPLFGIPA